MQNIKAKAVILLLSFFLIKCETAELSNSQITKAENGKQVSIKAGTDFSLVLDGNPTTGYIWQIKSIDTSSVSQNGNYEYKSSSGLMGAPGKFTFKFKALNKSRSLLKLYYLRGWEKGIPPIDSFKVNIIVN